MKRFFFGGIHPPYRKEMSNRSIELPAIVPSEVVIPLRQHIGAPCLPLVKVGERVLCGQKIGDGEGLCVPVHASVSGTVVAIEPRPYPNGQAVDAIIIENDRKDTPATFTVCDLPVEEMDADAVLHSIREAGIVGMGGAAFPGNVKALSAMGKIDTLIANACECEPYITADDMLLRTRVEEVLEGMMILSHLLSPDRIVVGIEDNKPESIKCLEALHEKFPRVEIKVLPTRYPQGAEKQLIQAVTGRQVPPGGLPAHVGCVVFNVSTFAAIDRAVRLGTPLFERIVTVSGEGVKNPQNFTVRIGTPFSNVIEAAGGLLDSIDRVINGGPMMGTAQSDLSVPVVKACNSILCLPKTANEQNDAGVCIRCGKCLAACPMHLQPIYINRYVDAGRVEQLVRLNVTDCMECGSCAFTCPAKLPLTEQCRRGKKLVKEAASK